jgi:tocopherol cyclase
MIRLGRVWRPEVYQGRRRPKKYFEGWYFKLSSKDEGSILALIPGVSYGMDGSKPHSFIQLIDGISCSTYYKAYDIKDFRFSRDRMEIWVGENYFSSKGIEINYAAEGLSISGKLSFTNTIPWPVTVLSPGIMGWYAFVPFMECYHGVVSMSHDISGSLRSNGAAVNYTGGRGYIEKDWGKSFPSAWIWMQSNHFDRSDVAFTASIARIPWVGSSFTGVIAGIIVNGRLYRFATYTGARLEKLAYEPGRISLCISNKHLNLYITARESGTGKLYSPLNGAMKGTIDESMTAEMDITLTETRGRETRRIFEGTGRCGGLEISGDISGLMPL